MFVELVNIFKERPVVIQTAYRDGKVHLMVAPKKLKDDENPAYWTPFSVSGTPEELDAGLSERLTRYVEIRQEVTASLDDALKAAEDQMKKSADEAKKKAADKVTAKKPAAKGVAVTPKISSPSSGGEDDEGGGDGQDAAPAETPAAVAKEAPQVSLF